MPTIPYGVVRSFLDGEVAKSGQFVSTGGALLSYNMPLAHKDAEGNVVLDYLPLMEGGPAVSRTTNRHMGALESVLSWESVPYTIEPRPVPVVATGAAAYLRR